MDLKQQKEAYSWSEAKRLASEYRYGTKIKVPKLYTSRLPPEFEKSILSIRGSANAVYRDSKSEDSYQVREYDDYWTIEMDRHNPEQGRPIRHAVADAPQYTVAAALVVGALIAGGS